MEPESPRPVQGRRAVPSTYIENTTARQVSFSKRKRSILQKTCEIVQKTGCRAFLLIQQAPGTRTATRRAVGVHAYACPAWRALYAAVSDQFLDMPFDFVRDSSSGEVSGEAYPTVTDRPTPPLVHCHDIVDKMSSRTDSSVSIELYENEPRDARATPCQLADDLQRRRWCFYKRTRGLAKKASQLVGMTRCRCLLLLGRPDRDVYHAYASPGWRQELMSWRVLSLFRQPAAATVTEYVPYGLPPRLFGAKIATHNAHGDRAISFSWKMPLHAAPPSGTVTPMPPPMSYAHDGPPDPDDSAVPPSPKRPRKTPTQLRDGLVETLSAAASLLCSV